MFKQLLLTTMVAGASLTLTAQVTTTPPLIQQSTENIVVYFHAEQGNQGLMNQPETARLYAHTGVITNQSTSPSDWKYAPTWGDNSAKYQLEYVRPNLWRLNIGSLRDFYNITDPDVTVTKMAFVFRNADGTSEAKSADGSDIFVDVLGDGMQVLLQSDNPSGTVIRPSNSTITFNLYCTEAADLTLTVNGSAIGSSSSATQLSAKYDFTAEGNYTVVGTAIAGGHTVSSQIDLVSPKASAQRDYPGGVPRMGALRNADGSVTFCLAAPQKESAMIIGSWNNYLMSADQTMYYQDYEGDRYFWTTVPNLEKGVDHIYYYLVDGEKKVGDPYARLVLDPYNDRYIPAEVYPDMPQYPYEVATDVPMAVFNDNLNDYDWQVKDFKGVPSSQLFIYELLFRDFTGTEGKSEGNGTVRAAIGKIPYLKRMGVNAVELLPICEFNGNNSWGYNPNFYFAPDKAYGTPDDYKEFIDECHRNGIAVILDMVFNQTDWLHPWYQLYSVGSNPFYNASAPHAYSVLNDWNQGYPLVRKQFKDVLKYWMEEYKIDGYRFDLVKGLGNNSSYPNSGDSGTNQFNQSRIDNMRDLQTAMLEVNPDAYFINENLAGAEEENAMAAFGQLNWANLNNQGCQYAMGYDSNSGLDRFYAPNDSRKWGSTVSYLESHDEQRLAYQQNTYGAAGVKGVLASSMHRLGSAAAQMMMAPGAHMVWMFSELGNYENTKDATGGNNTSPKKVNWALFDKPDRRGLYDNYAELAGIRNSNPEMFAEDVNVNIRCGASDWNNGRVINLTKNGRQILLAVNPNTSGADLTINAPFNTFSDNDYHILSKSYGTTPQFSAQTGTITVAPNCYVVVTSRELTEVDEIVNDNGASRLFVTAQDGVVTIMSAPGAVDIYTPSGVRVYTSPVPAQGATVSLPGGVYIVRSGNQSMKVALR